MKSPLAQIGDVVGNHAARDLEPAAMNPCSSRSRLLTPFWKLITSAPWTSILGDLISGDGRIAALDGQHDQRRVEKRFRPATIIHLARLEDAPPTRYSH